MIIFLIHGLGKCEGVSEDSRHGNGHVDIQVGSRIYLSVCFLWIIAYALRGSNPFRVIPLLGDNSPCRENIISGTRSVREDGSF